MLGRHSFYIYPLLLLLFCPEGSSASAVWSEKSNFPGTARHRTTSFSIGNKGYSGLGHHNSGPAGNTIYEDFWEYDPASDSWTQVADFGGGQRYHAADFVGNNKGYVIGGRSFADTLYMNDTWAYDPVFNTWEEMAEYPSLGRVGAMTFTKGEYGVFMMGLIAGSGIPNDVYAYHFDSDVWYSAPSFPGAERISAITFVVNEIPYLATGWGATGSMTDCWKMDTAAWTWSELDSIPCAPRGQAHGFSLGDYGYMLTGNDWSLAIDYPDMWRFDPITETWSQLSDFPGANRRYMDGFEIGNKAYMGLGTDGTNMKDLWEYDPAQAASVAFDEPLHLQVYPNPAKTSVRISHSSPIKRYAILNVSGQVVEQGRHTSPMLQLSVEHLKSGTYIFILEDKNKTIKKGRFEVLNTQ